MTVGEKIKALRKERGWNQSDLAKTIGFSQKTISSWENGDSKPHANSITMLAKLFLVSEEYLTDDAPETVTEEPKKTDGTKELLAEALKEIEYLKADKAELHERLMEARAELDHLTDEYMAVRKELNRYKEAVLKMALKGVEAE